MKTIIVEISGGSARVVRAPKETEVEIIDLDLLREGDSDDVRRYWNDSLSRFARRFIGQKYPRMLELLKKESIL